MATSEASSTVISLPNGGGALQGIGEKFSPDLFTGTGNGNGPFGLGWNLSIPGVSRKTSKGVPRYLDAEDVFILSDAEDLVPVSGDFSGKVQYRSRTEGLFARITLPVFTGRRKQAPIRRCWLTLPASPGSLPGS